MASELSPPVSSGEVFREVDLYDPHTDMASSSGHHLINDDRGISKGNEANSPARCQIADYTGEGPKEIYVPWFELYPSWLEASDEDQLRALSHAPPDYKFSFPHSEDRAHKPPPGFYTFYQDQLEGGLRFPIPEIFQQISSYYQTHLGQYSPNSIRTLCNFVVLFKALGFRVYCFSFSHFFLPKRSEEGPFYFTARPKCQFFEGAPSSNKYWKNHFFYVKPTDTWRVCSSWRNMLPELPTPHSSFRKDPLFTGVLTAIRGRKFHTPTLLAEDLLCYYGLNSANVTPQGHESTKLSSVCCFIISYGWLLRCLLFCFFFFF